MNISYNWLKEYVDFSLTPDEVAAALTSIGLETGGVEEVQTIKGGLEGLVIGEVLTCVPHPNSDHMHITTVNLGSGEPVQIVCGAPNVAAGQKVVVATLGTKLYDGDQCFTIKKSKLRGVESNGMICAEDEIGVGTDHAGIIVLPADVVPGTKERQQYTLILTDETDWESMYVDNADEWNSYYAATLGTFGPVKARFILVAMGEAGYSADNVKTIYNLTQMMPSYGFGRYMSILTSALDEWNSTHDTPLAEADGTPVSFPNN